MKTRFNRNMQIPSLRKSRGLTLLDVLLGMVIFAVGMLALASLQGNLTRSSADASQRTVGASLAEELIEQLRMYDALETGKGADPYQDIVDQTVTRERNGNLYTIAVTVDDYYFMPDGETVTMDTTELPADRNTTISDFKYLELAVSWEGGGFQGTEDALGNLSRLGSGAFTLSTIIPSVPQMGAAKVAAVDNEAAGIPPVVYTPGVAPDIIAVGLGDDKYKESTTPEPIVYRAEELLETWFDVITYSKAVSPNIFLRREEFVAVSCECLLHAASGSEGGDGRLPTLWNGVEYTEAAKVAKQYGTPTTGGKQSQYCDVCCNDHHDDGGGETSYRPWRTPDFSGDHPHYNRDKDGVLTAAVAGPAIIKGSTAAYTYIEACRLVRKDGFFRVAQDFQLDQINAFPKDYPGSADVAAYSSFIAAVADHEMGSGSDPGTAAATLMFDGYDPDHRSQVTDVGQQLRSRGIYLDTVTPELQTNIDDCFPTKTADCKAAGATTVYEMYPFFDVQLTSIARWTETALKNPVDISDEEIKDSGYSRGMASLAGTKDGPSKGESGIETGNVGLISTMPITDDPASAYEKGYIYLQAGDSSEPPGDGLPTITGQITGAGGILVLGVTLTVSGGEVCTKMPDLTFVCILDPTKIGATPTLTVSNYYKKGFHLLACSNSASVVYSYHVPTPPSDGGSAAGNYTVFDISKAGATSVIISIKKDSCA